MDDRDGSGAAGPPARTGAYGRSRLNALRHGLWSKTPVLPFESAEDYEALIVRLFREHAPVGAAEEDLVRELAHVIWRRRRLKWAELAEAAGQVRWAGEEEGHVVEACANLFRRAEDTVGGDARDEGPRGGPPGRLAMADYEILGRVESVLSPPWPETRMRVEAHLDRKFERTLATLVKLQTLRAPDAEADAPAPA